ncbi:uncharacterized protein LOC105200250 [Solenopsis invicta]|uniref:uncharacterized protein LOC105200250 n=1 Tax=Solenopsis invicta TaxID=13686 RepID=UPI00059587BD|nr:uncharacterized protein LOC105200250 [Solenopsis invicta]XP_011166019.1 uncharacterized protein LOC105200250 [Solenopsis invicta]XP_039311082.1 uncharacterized protein LOC105200250 [Solenopsis invicta]
MGKIKRTPIPSIKIKRLSTHAHEVKKTVKNVKYVRCKSDIMRMNKNIKRSLKNCKMRPGSVMDRRKLSSPLHSISSEATIYFETLKITADPQVDIDCVRNMSTVSIYDRNYRNPIQENISEDSVHIRPDVTQKLNNLNVDDESEDNCNVNTPQQDIESDILQRTSDLHIRDSSEPNIYDRIRNIVMS